MRRNILEKRMDFNGISLRYTFVIRVIFQWFFFLLIISQYIFDFSDLTKIDVFAVIGERNLRKHRGNMYKVTKIIAKDYNR